MAARPAGAPSGRRRRCCRARGSPPRRRSFPRGPSRLTHQVKFSRSFWKTRSRNRAVGDAPDPLLDLVDAPRRPGVHRRVHVAERPLVGGDLPVRVHVPLAEEEHELVLGEVGIHQRQRDRVEGEVPRGVPRVLPLVRHRDHVVVVEMPPLGVAPLPALRRRRGLAGIALEPAPDVVVVPLLRPEQPRQRLAHDAPRVLAEPLRDHGRVELVGLALARRRRPRRTPGRTAPAAVPSTSRSRRTIRPPAGTVEAVVGRDLGPRVAREQALFPAVDDRLVERVLPSGVGLAVAEQAADVGLVVGEEERRRALGSRSGSPAESSACSSAHDRAPAGASRPAQTRLPRVAAPRSTCSGARASGSTWSGAALRAAVVDGHADQDVVGLAFAYSTSTSK